MNVKEGQTILYLEKNSDSKSGLSRRYISQLIMTTKKRKREKCERPIKAHFNEVSHSFHFTTRLNGIESNSIHNITGE